MAAQNWGLTHMVHAREHGIGSPQRRASRTRASGPAALPHCVEQGVRCAQRQTWQGAGGSGARGVVQLPYVRSVPGSSWIMCSTRRRTSGSTPASAAAPPGEAGSAPGSPLQRGGGRPGQGPPSGRQEAGEVEAGIERGSPLRSVGWCAVVYSGKRRCQGSVIGCGAGMYREGRRQG